MRFSISRIQRVDYFSVSAAYDSFLALTDHTDRGVTAENKRILGFHVT